MTLRFGSNVLCSGRRVAERGVMLLVAACDTGASTAVTGSGGAASSQSGDSAVAAPPAIDAQGGCVPGQMTGSGTLYGPYGTRRVRIDGQDYILQVNEWNASAPQAMEFGNGTFFRMTQQEASVPTNGGPAGFPSMFIGRNTGPSSGLPKQVATLASVPTAWTWNDGATLADTNAHIFNAAYDVWFSIDASGDPGADMPSGGFLMVWLHKPPNAQPLGRVEEQAVQIPGVVGAWDIWIGANSGVPCISYVSRDTTLTLSFDLNLFVQDAVNNWPGTVQSSWYLTNVFIGFEIWQGGVGLETTSFCVYVQ